MSKIYKTFHPGKFFCNVKIPPKNIAVKEPEKKTYPACMFSAPGSMPSSCEGS